MLTPLELKNKILLTQIKNILIFIIKINFLNFKQLTIKGVSKEKKVPMKLTKNGSELTLSGTFTVNRAEHKVGKKSDSVPDIMNITYSIPVTKK